jgi:xanthine dehydrogenase molybdenum-binding subunit
MAAHSCSHGAMSLAMSAIVRMDQSGAMDVNNGLTEIGGGQSTAMTMIAAETLGAKFEESSAGWGDTSTITDTGGTWGSRGTISAGSPTRMAALHLKEQIIAVATSGTKPLLAAKPEECDTGDGYVFIKADPSKKVAMKDVVNSTGSPMIGRGTYVVPPGYMQGVFSAGFAEIEVDLDTGEITLLRYVLSNDVGRAINPLGVEQQMEGGATLSIGFGVGEETRFDPQANFAVNWSYENYSVPTVLEAPHWADFTPIIVEPGDAIGPYGAKGVGEPPAAPPAPAIANALYNAIGVRIHDAPITRDKVLAAIKQMKR